MMMHGLANFKSKNELSINDGQPNAVIPNGVRY